MLSKILLRRKLLIVVLAGFVFLLLISYFILKNPIQSDSIPIPTNITSFNGQAKMNAGLPVRLKIPSISVDAAIESIGLTSQGAMDIPKNPGDAAWFNLGSRPGANGSAVIDGHYGTWKNGSGSVFDNLYKLHQGDQLYVEDDKGAKISFVVREIRSYDPKANASDVFGSSDGKSHLNLITCEGVWDKDSKSYPKRLVVFTDRE